MHAAEHKDTRTMLQILDLLGDAEMAFEKAVNARRTGITVVEAQGEPWRAIEAVISCLVEGLRLMQMAFEKGQQNQSSGDDGGWPVESTTFSVNEKPVPVKIYLRSCEIYANGSVVADPQVVSIGDERGPLRSWTLLRCTGEVVRSIKVSV